MAATLGLGTALPSHVPSSKENALPNCTLPPTLKGRSLVSGAVWTVVNVKRSSQARPTSALFKARAAGDDEDLDGLDLGSNRAFTLPGYAGDSASWFLLAGFCKVFMLIMPWSPYLWMMVRNGVALPPGLLSSALIVGAGLGLAYVARKMLDEKQVDRKWVPLLLWVGGAVAMYGISKVLIGLNAADMARINSRNPPLHLPPRAAKPPPPPVVRLAPRPPAA